MVDPAPLTSWSASPSEDSLGRVECMLGRDKEALRHFNEVLELQPHHVEAASEKRIIELRLAAANDKSGLFRKR